MRNRTLRTSTSPCQASSTATRPGPPARAGRNRHPIGYKLLILSLSGFIALLVTGIVSLIAYFQLARQERVIHGWRNPLELIVAARIRPDLALLPLAGVSSEEAVREALAAGEPDTAFAIVVYATDLDGATRGGLFKLVGERFVQASRPNDASLCFQLAHDLAALSPDLADVARFDLSLAAARGRLAVGDDMGLALSLEQAETLIRYSALMQPVQRLRASEQLVRLVAEVRGERAAAQLKASLSEDVNLRPLQGLAPFMLLAFAAPLPLHPELEQIRLERQRRALALIDQWIALEGGDVGPEQLDLAEFLRREELARLAWYTELAQAGLNPDQRVTLLSEQIAWLLIQLQAARGDFGISLVPEWEGRQTEIWEALVKNQADLFALFHQQAAQLADQRDIDQAELELIRLELINWRLGRYPGLDPDERDAALGEVTARVRQRFAEGGAAKGSGVLPAPRITDGRRSYILVGGASP